MATWLIILIIWLIGAPICYFSFIKNWKHPMWEKIAISLSWPVILPLYIIYLIHMASK